MMENKNLSWVWEISSHESDVISTSIILSHIIPESPTLPCSFGFVLLLNVNEIGLAACKKQVLYVQK